jgi:hypothetical protein
MNKRQRKKREKAIIRVMENKFIKIEAQVRTMATLAIYNLADVRKESEGRNFKYLKGG